mmetsp:Transcript_13005/g.45727  ORF Transcript_13005/g.45727 Transcript_13005/m.45727 type:complete len:283 (-) Transcript_13005:1034-1882(-)
MLPRIHSKGNYQKQAQGNATARGNTARSHSSVRTTDSSKFSKLKEVLVNNLLKDYHRKNKKAGNDAIYLKAVEEVEKILTHGRLTDKQLKDLQRKFSAMDGIPEAAAVSDHAEQDSYPRRTEVDEVNSYRPQPPPTASTQTSPSKRRKQIDEWSVMTLYNDVKHYEEQKKMKEKVKNEQQRTREELAAQIEERKKQKAAVKEQERRVADEQRKKYEEWQQEMKLIENEKLQKLLEERKREAIELKRAQDRKKMQAEKQMQEEAAIIQQFQQEEMSCASQDQS